MESYSDHIARFSTALADPTRREIMDFVAYSVEPLCVRDIADHFGLHANAARMHLDKLVKGGLLKVLRRRLNRGGRPANLYSASDEGLELHIPPRRYKLLAVILAQWASSLGDQESSDLGREAFLRGREEALRTSSSLAYIETGSKAPQVIEAWLNEARNRGLKVKLRNLNGTTTGLVFLSCPFGELSIRYPDLVCDIHRHIEEGFLSLCGNWRVHSFHDDEGCVFSLSGSAD